MQVIIRPGRLWVAWGISEATGYRLIEKRLLTRPARISLRGVGWPENEIDEISQARIAGKSDAEIRALVERLEAARTASTSTGAASV
jgi:prophage regulatory protein